MAGTVVADQLEAASTSTLVLKNGVANTPPTVQDSAGTQIGTFCRAWVNFNGTTVTNPASMTGVRGSFNVSSILDNGTGDYTVNFTTAMSDANYCTCVGGSRITTSGADYGFQIQTWSQTTTAVRMNTPTAVGATADWAQVNISIFR